MDTKTREKIKDDVIERVNEVCRNMNKTIPATEQMAIILSCSINETIDKAEQAERERITQKIRDVIHDVLLHRKNCADWDSMDAKRIIACRLCAPHSIKLLEALKKAR